MLPEPERWLECRGMMCPLPLIELSKVLRAGFDGALLGIRGDDPALPADLRAWCRAHGHTIVGLEQHGRESSAVLEIRQK